MLHLDVQAGDRIEIDDGRIVIHVGRKSGQRTRLGFEADKSVAFRRISQPEGEARATGTRRLAHVA